MNNNGGTQDEQESVWNAAHVGSLGRAGNLPAGQSSVSSPENRPGWDLPIVQASPKQPRTAVLAPQKGERVLHLSEKICILGDSGVGKTSIVKRYAHDSFDDGYLTTCGAKVTQRKINLNYPRLNIRARLSVQIWDITGERRGGLNRAFFKGASGALVVGDAARLETQLDIWKWIEDLQAEAGNVPVVIVVNKSDILDKEEFDYLLMDDLANEYGCQYTMASARTNFHVDRAFRMLCDYLVMTRLAMEREGANAC